MVSSQKYSSHFSTNFCEIRLTSLLGTMQPGHTTFYLGKCLPSRSRAQSIFSSFKTNLMMFENNSFHPRISQFLHYDAVSTRVITTSRLQSSTSCPLHCLLWTIYTSADIIQNQHHHNQILNIQIQLPLNFVSLVAWGNRKEEDRETSVLCVTICSQFDIFNVVLQPSQQQHEREASIMYQHHYAALHQHNRAVNWTSRNFTVTGEGRLEPSPC